MSGAQPIAFVTGAGTGIGRAVAIGLCRKGYAVVGFGCRPEMLEETSSLVHDGRMLVISGDVADPESVRRAFETTGRTFGRLDLLFNNAGTGAPPVGIDELDIDQWLRVVHVNLNGAFFCAREAFRMMRRQQPRGGRIINNGSISAHAPRPGSAAYTTTKHAITGLTRSLSLDGRAYDIACGQIDIGNADTELTQAIKQGVMQADGTIRPESTMAVEDVVNAVMMMASLPLSSNVQSMTIMASKMPFVGRG